MAITTTKRSNNTQVPKTVQPAYQDQIDTIVDDFTSYVGSAVTPIVRTNNPTLAANSSNANISALDAAIGVTPTSTNTIAAASSVNVNLSTLDAYLAVLATNNVPAIITATGANQGNSTAILATTGIISVVGMDDTTGVRLPDAAVGKTFIIYGTATLNKTLNIWPSTGGVIDALAANAKITMLHASVPSVVMLTYAGANKWTATAIIGTKGA